MSSFLATFSSNTCAQRLNPGLEIEQASSVTFSRKRSASGSFKLAEKFELGSDSVESELDWCEKLAREDQLRGDSIIANYISSIKEEDFSFPETHGLWRVSSLMDWSFQRCYEEQMSWVRTSNAVEEAALSIQSQPDRCGGFTEEQAVLKGLTPMEQISALSIALDKTKTLPKTFALSTPEGGYIPVWFKKHRQPSLMHVRFGNSTGSLKAPIYDEWAQEDPRHSSQRTFIGPLNALEAVRQPRYLASLVVKSLSYQNERMPHSWRYKVYDDQDKQKFACEASVELPKQSSEKAFSIKSNSAGFNLAKMMVHSDFRDQNLLPELNYEDFHQEGYDDDFHPRVTPRDLLLSLPKAGRGQEDDLDQLCNKLFALNLSGSNIPEVQKQVAETLFPSKNF